MALTFSFLIASLLPGIAFSQIDPEEQIADEQRLIDGLRKRHLFDLALHVCNRHLDDQQSSPVLQAVMGIEVIRIHSTRAAQADPDSRDALWEKVHQSGNEFDRRFPNHPRKILVDVQQAMTWLDRGRMLAFELEAGWGGPEKKAQIEKILASAIQRLSEQEREIERLIPKQRRNNLQPEELTAEQLQALHNNVRYQIAQAHRYQAMFLEKQVDVEDSLRQVLGTLDELQQKVGANDPLWINVQIDRATSMRLMKNFEEAQRILMRIQDIEANRIDVLSELLRVAIERKHEQHARSYTEQISKRNDQNPETDLLIMQATLALAEWSKDKSSKKRLEGRALTMSDAIHQQHGSYWGRRARMLLIHVESPITGNSSNVQVAIAQKAFQQQRWGEAVAAFRAAAQLADQAQDQLNAFKWYRVAAAILQQQKDYRAASDAYRELATRYSDHEEADNVHLLACWNLSQLVINKKATLDDYARLLEEHINHFGQRESCPQVRLWYARVLAIQKQWKASVDQCFKVELASQHCAAAIQQAVDSGGNWIRSTADADEQSKIRSRLILGFRDKLASGLEKPESRWAESDRRAILALAKFSLDDSATDLDEVIVLLTNAIRSIENRESRWVQHARIWLTIYQAVNSTEANECLSTLRQVEMSDEAMDELFRGLHRAAARANSQMTSLPKLQVASFLKVQPRLSKASTRQQVQWSLIHARGLFDSGQEARAFETYEQLAKSNSKSISIQLEYARKLVLARQEKNHKKALHQWRKIAVGTRKPNEVWFEAKLRVAQLLAERGQHDQAAKMLKLIQLVPPGWSKSKWASELDQMLKTLEKSPGS